jgi:peptide/nickel transport system substrate-binding protein
MSMSDVDRRNPIHRPGVVSRRRVLALLGAGASVSLLAACQPGTPAAPTVVAKPTSAPAPPPAAAATVAPTVAPPRTPAAQAPAVAQPTAVAVGNPVAGGQMVIGQDLDPVHMDPQIDISFPIAQAIEHAYDALTVYDENMQIQPSLAQSWEISPDGLTYVFHLRKDVKWHNGRQFVASDVVYWYERVLDQKINTQQRPKYLVIQSADILDDYTVKFNLSQPWSDLLAEMATFRPGAIPNKETVDQFGDLKTHAVGTGPYKVVEFKAGDFIRYRRNEDYWGKKPYIDEIVLKVMVQEAQRIAALRTGQIHLGLLSPVGARTLANETNVSVRTSPLGVVRMVWLGTEAKPLNDQRVRKALDMAIDRQELIQKVMLGQAVLSGPTPTGHGNWSLPEDKLPAYYRKVDIAGAKQLLAEAGYPNGFKTMIRTSSAPADYPAICVVLQQQWKAIGVDLEIQQLEPTAAVASKNPDGTPTFEMLMSNFTFYPSPDTYVGNWMPERNLMVRKENEAMKNPAIMDLLAKGQATQDPMERQQLYWNAQTALIDMAPGFWLYAINQIDGISNQLQGYQQSFTGRRYLARNAWLRQ